MDIVNDIDRSLKIIIGAKCWIGSRIISGALDLNFGNVLFQKTVCQRNTFLTGQYNIFVWCHWILNDGSVPICNAESTLDEIICSISSLEGYLVTDVELYPPALDLTLSFASGKVLRVFCDSTDVEDADMLTNWTLGIDDTYYSVNRSRIIEKEKRDIIPGIACDASRIIPPSDIENIPHVDIEKQIESRNSRIPLEELLEIRDRIKND